MGQVEQQQNLKPFFFGCNLSHSSGFKQVLPFYCCKQEDEHTSTKSKSHYLDYQPALAERQGMLFLSALLLLLLQPVLLINEEVLGPQLLIRAYRLSVCTANQSQPSDSWAMKNVAWWMEGRLVWGGNGVVEERREVKEHSI